ncbi:MAG: MBL fold metallo-hydrolase [Bacteroidaceae bacterium]|nr:MBL fold metallo-hydrolase [Bacteroidaceae bacterium]
MLQVTHVINSVYTSRTYILTFSGSNRCWLVDCGDVEPITDKVSALTCGSFQICGVLLTHAHYDHIYGLPGLTELFPQIMVYTNGYGKKALANERVNMSRYHEDPINYESDNVIVCDEDDVIDLFEGVQAKVHYTPGHNPSCLTFEIGNYLFTGDAYIPGVAVVTNLPGGDKPLAAQSLARIQALAQGKTLCPGHE